HHHGHGDHGHHHHAHHGHHSHAHEGDHEDLNLRAAYLHVVADAATSVLAIAALFSGKLWGLTWLDPVMGLVGALLVTVWAVGLLKETARGLLDADMNAPVVEEIREAIEQGPIPAHLADLHVWRVGPGRYACIVSLDTPAAEAQPEDFKRLLRVHEELVHISVEVNHRASVG
ncbi:MAG TPA: cation diffusion facilitator family transporter, partial [Candidatus Aquabacterium excrementipullorum]|nr:cation diffusion facilitator family transporter [Candidatus Aquabacterium excrementipullorum]